MRFRGTVLLFAVLVVLCLAYWMIVRTEDEARRRAVEARRVFAVDQEAFHTIRVERIGEPAVLGARSESGAWRITEPNDINAQEIVWNRMAEALAGLSNEGTVTESPEDPGIYGLDEPQLTVQAWTKTDDEVQVAFGTLEPTQLYRYARAGDDAVFLVANEAFFELDRSLLDLRYRYLFRLGETGITRVEFARVFEKEGGEGAGGSLAARESVPVVLEAGEEGVWRMRQPVEALANQERVAMLIRGLSYTAGRDYVDAPEDLSLYGLNPPGARLTVKGGPDGMPQTLYFGDYAREDESGGVFAKRASSPAVFVIDAAVINALPEEPFAFREKRLLTHRASNLRAVDYRAGNTEFRLENDPEQGWQMVRPAVEDTDQMAVSTFIAFLKQAEGKDFPETVRPEFGLDQPAVSLALTFEGHEEPAIIRLGAALADGSGDYYATQDIGAVAVVSALVRNGVSVNSFYFRSKDLMRFAGDEAVAVAMEFEGTAYLFEKVDDRWQVSEPPGMRWESQSDMEAVLDTLGHIRAVARETDTLPEDFAPYGLDGPLLAARVTVVSGGDREMLGPLTIGRTTDNDWHQRFAAYKDRQEIFRVKQAVIDDIREALQGLGRQP
jgi:hypothetical protein